MSKMKISIRDVLSLSFLHRRGTLVISGGINSDTNALARALAMKAERAGLSVMTVNADMLDEESTGNEAVGLSSVRLISVAKPQLLIIENFGLKKLAPLQAKILSQLIAERVNKESTIITSLYPLSAWASQLGLPTGTKSLLNVLTLHAGRVVIGTKGQESRDGTPKRKPAPSTTVQART